MRGAHEDLIPEKITYVFQSQSLFPALTVVENVALPLVVSGGQDFADQRSMALLAEFELDGLADKLPDELSGGQAQRVALARALVTQPLLILADEPTGQLDAATARSLIDVLLRHIEGTSTALLIATHDLKIAERMETQWSMRHGVLETDIRSSVELVAVK
jgi:putative ABC transport system ATP-binding protein/lipoprotein-releasing system ATP-binding protein